MSKFNRKSILAAAGGFAAATAFAAMLHSAKAQVQSVPPGAGPAPAGTPAVPPPAVNPAMALPPLSGPIAPAKVGTVSLSKILANSKRFADARTQFSTLATSEQIQSDQRHQGLKISEGALNQMARGTDAYHQASIDFQKKQMQVQMDDKLSQLTLQHQQVLIFKLAYDDLSSAVSKVAVAKQLDMVMIDSGGDLPAGDPGEITLDQLEQVIQSRHVLYSSKGIDITGDVAQQMDLAAHPPATPPAGH